MDDKNDIMIIRQVAEQAACFYFLLAKSAVCATICITLKNNGRLTEMVIEIDFNSDEAIYVQLMNQIIMGIATSRLQEGDPLPSVRQLADTVRFCYDRPQTWGNYRCGC